MSFDTTALWEERYSKIRNLALSEQLKADASTRLSQKQSENRTAVTAATKNEEVKAFNHDLNMKKGVLRQENEELEERIAVATKDRNRQRDKYTQAKAERKKLDSDLEHARGLPLVKKEKEARRATIRNLDDKKYYR